MDNKIIDLIKTQPKILLPVTPIGKPRMVSSDKWFRANLNHSDRKKRKRAEMIKRYFNWCEAVRWSASSKNYELQDRIAVEFRLPFPKSYSTKKRELLVGKPHQVKPDCDNMLKALVDALAKSDSHVWFKASWKVWTEGEGAIVLYQI